MKIGRFDRSLLKVKSLSDREHDLDISSIINLGAVKISKRNIDKKLNTVANRIISAKKNNRAIVLLMGAHVIRAGVQNFLIDLMQRGYISCLSMNGACIIHDFEFALIGATTESVARYIKEGQFGLWQETARLNDIINKAYKMDRAIGMGEAVGRYIEDSPLPYKDVSILATACRLNIPVTVHVGIGYDILHEHPNCDGAATGALSYNDFLKFASVVRRLEGGVLMSFGSATMAPEVFLKALSMARNIARQQDKEIRHFTTLVCDLVNLPKNIRKEESKDKQGYYFRPWKTLLIRTVAEGGEGFYVRGKHIETIPGLWAGINRQEEKFGKSN